MGSMTRLHALGRRIAEEQDGMLRASEFYQHLRPAIARIRPSLHKISRPKPQRTTLLAAAAVLVAMAAAWLVMSRRSLQFEVGIRPVAGHVGAWISASHQEPLPIHFSDGTELMLMAGSRGRVAQTTPRGARVVLESGQASFSAPHHENSHWEVSTGPFVVTVTGTRFFVGWDPASDIFELRVQQGSVKVTGCVFGDGGRAVLAGEMLRASCDAATYAIAKAGTPSRSSRAPERRREPSRPVGRPEPSEAMAGHKAKIPVNRPIVQSWRDLAGAGDYSAALEAAEAAGFERQCSTLDSGDLTRLGDVARFAGRLDLARRAYEAVRNRFPGTERAAIAAFTLGRMAQDQQGAPGVAARWYRTCLAEQPEGGLAREALGRLVEALHRAGDRDGAQRVAAQYVRRHPRGPHAALAEQLLRVGDTAPADP
jgi:transmembrane sensor